MVSPRGILVARAEPGGGVVVVEAHGVSRRAALEALAEGGRLADELSEAVAEAPFHAVFLETPPVARTTAGRPFAAVLVEAPALAGVEADPEPFARELARAEDGVATFPNLGGDAVLVAPAAEGPLAPHAHLAAFVRGVTRERVRALWRAVGRAALERLGEEPLWISTSGLGVAWLHVRLDERPKYYQHGPFRSPDA